VCVVCVGVCEGLWVFVFGDCVCVLVYVCLGFECVSGCVCRSLCVCVCVCVLWVYVYE